MSLKYRPAIVETFIDHYTTGLYTLTELCKMVDISMTTFYWWKEKIPEFQKKLEEADKRRVVNIKEIAVRGMIKLLTGVEYDEVYEEFEMPPAPATQEDLEDLGLGDLAGIKLQDPTPPVPILKKRKVTKKFIMPSAAMVQFALRNVDKDNFPDTQLKEQTVNHTTPVPVAVKMPDGINLNLPTSLEDDTDITPPVA